MEDNQGRQNERLKKAFGGEEAHIEQAHRGKDPMQSRMGLRRPKPRLSFRPWH